MSDPEDVKKIIGQQGWKNGTKMLAVYAYDAFAKMEKITWTPPKYKQEENIPFVPNEEELDQLIAACNSRRMATFLQTLKETYADLGEILKLKWIDINGEIITINNPVKGHLPGQMKISQKLIAMLNSLPKKSEKVFPTSYQSIENSFLRIRKKAAERLKNPRLSAVQFRSFRHWGGSMIAHYTNGNVLTVKKLLRHKSITSTMKYITMLDFKDDDEFDVATATTVEEIKQLASLGYQKFDEIKGIHIYRKPKRFNAKR